MNDLSHKHIFISKNTATFFSKKKLFFFLIFGLIFIGMIFFTFYYTDINIPKIFSLLSKSAKENKIIILYIILIISYQFVKSFYNTIYIRPRLMKYGVHISTFEYIFLYIKVFVINCITPFATGSEPYTIYWMVSRGATIKQANTITVTSGIANSISDILVTIPSFIYISTDYNNIINSFSGSVVYWFIVVGLIVNIMVLLITFLLGLSKRIHYLISLFSNFILRKLRKNYLEKDEIYKKYIIEFEFRNSIIEGLKEKKFSIYIFITFVINSFYYYNTLYLSFISISNDQSFQTIENYFLFFNITNVSITANNFIPIPGSEGTIQLSILSLFNSFSDSKADIKIINDSVALWRIFTVYLPLIIYIVFLIGYYSTKFYYMKKEKLFKKKTRRFYI